MNGNDDMYDVGNMINVPANTSNHVVYLRNCQQGTVNGQPYWMAMNNSGYSVTLFTPYLKDNISISGNLGNDGKAYQSTGSFNYKGWRGFWKIVEGTSVNAGVSHLWVTDAPNATHEVMFGDDDDEYDDDYDEYEGSGMIFGTGNDQDALLHVAGHNLVYIMWGTKPSYGSSASVMEQLVKKIYDSFGTQLKLVLK